MTAADSRFSPRFAVQKSSFSKSVLFALAWTCALASQSLAQTPAEERGVTLDEAVGERHVSALSFSLSALKSHGVMPRESGASSKQLDLL